MKEIQERAELYYGYGRGCAYRWREGCLQFADADTGKWEESCRHENFMRGEFFPLDPLTGEFVCAPKPKDERPYDMTTEQMSDDAERGTCNKYKSDCGMEAVRERGSEKLNLVTPGGLWMPALLDKRLSLAMWRREEAVDE